MEEEEEEEDCPLSINKNTISDSFLAEQQSTISSSYYYRSDGD